MTTVITNEKWVEIFIKVFVPKKEGARVFFSRLVFPENVPKSFTPMPAKRKGDVLTGGTGDVNPQSWVVYHAFSNPATTSTNTSTGFPVPIPKYPGANNRAIVMEILEVEWQILDAPLIGTNAAAGGLDLLAVLTTDPLAPANVLALATSPKNISIFRRSFKNPLAASTSVQQYDLTEQDDLTDSAGHGILVGTDSLYIRVMGNSDNTNASWPATNAISTIKYRMKEVGLAEYIGIVQSQQ